MRQILICGRQSDSALRFITTAVNPARNAGSATQTSASACDTLRSSLTYTGCVGVHVWECWCMWASESPVCRTPVRQASPGALLDEMCRNDGCGCNDVRHPGVAAPVISRTTWVSSLDPWPVIHRALHDPSTEVKHAIWFEGVNILKES